MPNLTKAGSQKDTYLIIFCQSVEVIMVLEILQDCFLKSQTNQLHFYKFIAYLVPVNDIRSDAMIKLRVFIFPIDICLRKMLAHIQNVTFTVSLQFSCAVLINSPQMRSSCWMKTKFPRPRLRIGYQDATDDLVSVLSPKQTSCTLSWNDFLKLRSLVILRNDVFILFSPKFKKKGKENPLPSKKKKP